MKTYRVKRDAWCVAGLGLDETVIADSRHVTVLSSEIRDHGLQSIDDVDRWFSDMWIEFSSEVHSRAMGVGAEVAVLRVTESEWPRRTYSRRDNTDFPEQGW